MLLAASLPLGTELSPELPQNEYSALPEWTRKLGPFSGRFAGQKVLVTGGSSGIGLAAVLGFRQECADVVLAGSSAAKARATHEALLALPTASCAAPPKLGWAAANVANRTEALDLVASAVSAMNR